MSKKQRELIDAVDSILWNDWDPIGINDCGPDDEYRGFVPVIVKLLMRNADADEIANQLHLFAYENMGLDSTPEANMDIAKKLLTLISKEGINVIKVLNKESE